MYQCDLPWGRPSISRFRGAVPVRVIAVVAASVIVAAIVALRISHSSAEDLLQAGQLSPDQIRTIATKLLLHEDPKIRERASSKLSSTGKPAAPILKEVALTDSDARVRLAVLGILMAIDADGTVDVLERMIDDPNVEVRRAAVQSAVKLTHPRAVPLLIKGLRDSDGGIRASAASGLGTKGAPEAISPLLNALNDPSVGVRRHVARALRTLTGRDYSDRIQAE